LKAFLLGFISVFLSKLISYFENEKNTVLIIHFAFQRNMNLRKVAKRNDIIDPVTFKYIPWEERTEHDDGYSSDGSDVKLPVLKVLYTL